MIKLISILSMFLIWNCTLPYKEVQVTTKAVPIDQELKDSVLINLINPKILEYPSGVEFSITVIKNCIPSYYGVRNNNGSTLKIVNQEKAFEIGSMTKVFTSHLFAETILNKNLNPDAKLQELTDLPIKTSGDITLKQLASHSSGLPVMPNSFFDSDYDEENPYSDFNEKELLAYLKNEISIDTSMVNKFSYSNVGVSILGYLLSLSEGKDYESLVRDNILLPLEMNHTTLSRSEIQGRLIDGIKLDGTKGSPWDLKAVKPAGGLYSTSKDLGKYVLNCFDENNKIFALQSEQIIERTKSIGQGLGWMIVNSKSGKQYFFHAGATGVYSTIFIIDPEKKNAIILLSNIETGQNDVDSFGFKLMKELNSLD